MNPVNATALYVSASRAVLQCDPRQPHTFAEMYKLLPFFRQSLACLVCGKQSCKCYYITNTHTVLANHVDFSHMIIVDSYTSQFLTLK